MQHARIMPYERGKIAGQCLAPLAAIDLEALPWDERHPEDSERFSEIQRVKKSNTRSVLSFLITDPDEIPVRVYAKRCRARNLTKRLLSLGRQSKARREWMVGRELLDRAIPTALPLLWAERRVHGMMTENYLVTLGIDRSVSFAQLWSTLAKPEDRATWMRILGANIRLGHDNNFAHDDLSTEHVLVASAVDVFNHAPTCYYIDLDRARIDGPVSAYRRAHNFFQIFRSLPSDSFGAAERREFYNGYSHGKWTDELAEAFDVVIARIALLKAIGKALKPRNWFKSQ